MKKKESKNLQYISNFSGITLIALVVTIVVLIILATVSINIIFAEEGIIERAKLAKQDYANAEEEEKETLTEVSNSIDRYIKGEREKSTLLEERILNLETKITALEAKNDTVLLEEVSVQSQVPAPGGSWGTIKEISFSEYGTGKAIISYSATNGENNNYYIATQIMKNSTMTQGFDETIATDTSDKWAWLLSSTSTTISYDENTTIQLQSTGDVAYNPIYSYSILIMPD